MLMDSREQNRIDQLLADIADEGASRDRIEELSDLLCNRADLQQYYLLASGLHILLEHEFELAQQGRLIADFVDEPNSRDDRAKAHGFMTHLRVNHSPSPSSGVTRKRSWRRPSRQEAMIGVAVAATVLIGVFSWVRSFGVSTPSPNGPVVHSESAHPSDDRNALRSVDLVIRDSVALNFVSNVIRTDAITSLQLPRHSPKDLQPLTLCSGTAWMERGPGEHERGHVVELLPGCRFDLYVDANAGIYNSLAVIELDDQGRITGASSFDNLIDGDLSNASRRWGAIGTLSEFNRTSASKYYLLTASHILAPRSADDAWHQSDFKVLTNSNDHLVVGWDDSGFSPRQQRKTAGFLSDGDFDDIRAIVRFSRPRSKANALVNGVAYTPPAEPLGLVENGEEIGPLIDVKPGEEVMLVLSSSSAVANRFQVIDSQSRQIIWERAGWPFNDVNVRQSTVEGAFVIRNLSNAVRQYELRTQYAQPDLAARGEWKEGGFIVRPNGSRSITAVFGNHGPKPTTWATPGVNVHARWFSE